MKLYVQPAELARKLVKELESHKVPRAGGVSVRNRYTVFLCPEDYERLRDRVETLTVKLERHLTKHVRSKKYDIPAAISLAITVDDDLQLGHFGILAERTAPGLSETHVPSRIQRSLPSGGSDARDVGDMRDASLLSGRLEIPPTVPPVLLPAERQEAAHVKLSRRPRGSSRAGATEIVPPEDAANLDLARQTIVLRAGNREREFTQGRVIIGRSRDVDFRIDDPNVSRRHAAVFWSEGRIVVEDLDSTNGTMVNGYPVSSTAIRTGDKIVIGDCHITVETR